MGMVELKYEITDNLRSSAIILSSKYNSVYF
jgi:hypothetical protein